MNKKNPREVALKIVYDVLEKGDFSNIILNKYLKDKEIKDIDKKLITELAYGTIRKIITIDYIIECYSKIKLKKISPWILNIIRIGVYQVFYCEKIPDFAICSESLVLTKKYGHQGTIGFVNGMLRNIIRNKDKIRYPDKKENLTRFLAVNYALPEWLIKRWIENFGINFTEELLKYNQDNKSRFTIRINPLKIKLSDLQIILKNDNILTSKSEINDEILVIDNIGDNQESSLRLDTPIYETRAYKEGLFHIQSESSMLPTEVLNPQENEIIIDLCSAPGGKTTHIAQKMKNNGKVIAMDINKSRLKQVSAHAKRLELYNIETVLNDGTQFNKSLNEIADRVLVDAPCSGMGIINKRPDILLNRKSEDINNLALIQKKILTNAAKYLKIGGVLVYSTCSIEPDENELIIRDFLTEHKNFVIDSITDYLPDSLKKFVNKDSFLTLYPHINGIDGFFIARLLRKD